MRDHMQTWILLRSSNPRRDKPASRMEEEDPAGGSGWSLQQEKDDNSLQKKKRPNCLIASNDAERT
eukprot:CAMPEP_0170170678 /NCGR_PEP_ID=MMETSP0040_2-20121228/3676_1 /TAXON_ID=641309 /ORGANISM="Lotharella oceanica, Strain CCMP622" /LENGTH=65 /DNA_ID=CAMNT_0010410225 /DNA_START=198 /DNA_END=395 /DNA_ORIENTATION=+